MQTNEQATNKSTSFNFLLQHTTTYSLIWFGFLSLGLIINDYYHIWSSYTTGSIFIFTFITLILHTLTDFITSKINSKNIPKREFLNNDETQPYFRYLTNNWCKFFIGIGFDQILHYAQLFLTYGLIFKQ